MKSRWEDLELLLAVVDAGSFTAAAEMLGTSPARLSRAVSRLETALESTLINRTTRRLETTEEGDIIIDRARRALNDLESAEETLAVRRREPAGRLRVDAATPFLLHQIVPHLEVFHHHYPKVRLELTTHETNIDLLENRTDIAIRIGELKDSSLHARPLGRSRRRLVASPAYLARHGAPQDTAALKDHSLLGFTHPAWLNRWPVGNGDEIRPTLASSSGEALRQMAVSGLGIACLADFLIHDDLKDGRLQDVLAETTHEEYERIQAVYYRHTSLVSRIGAFLDFIAPRLRL
ncbi:LysR family transcriptional regulator [Halomonas shantousis]